MQPPRVALIGVKGAGKTTLALGMEDAGFVRMALAGPVKDAAHAAVQTIMQELGLPPIGRERFDRDKTTFRVLLQWLGTDLVRDYCERQTYWIDRLLTAVQECESPVVVDDVRFANEVAALRANGFVIWKLVSPGMDDTDQHPSETFARTFQDADLVIANAWSEPEHREMGMKLGRHLMQIAGVFV